MKTAALAVVLAKLLTAPIAPAARDVIGPTMQCVFLSQAELRGTDFAGTHAVACVDFATGDILGAMLRRSGVPRCTLAGHLDLTDACWVLSGCHRTVRRC